MTTENTEGRFNTHLLTLEEVWYVREHRRHAVVNTVVTLVREIEELEDYIDQQRGLLDAAVEHMNKRRNAQGRKG